MLFPPDEMDATHKVDVHAFYFQTSTTHSHQSILNSKLSVT